MALLLARLFSHPDAAPSPRDRRVTSRDFRFEFRKVGGILIKKKMGKVREFF